MLNDKFICSDCGKEYTIKELLKNTKVLLEGKCEGCLKEK
jgi:DNA-directed RNA polymerase subunit RPC12/RpoP